MSSADYMTQYKAISAKLKKRFLRKPNVAEASAQFTSLSRELENDECPHYAAFCCLAVARCEHTVGNAVNESANLVHAARLFLEKEEESHRLLCPCYHEYMQAAESAFLEAIKVHVDNQQPSMAANLYLELGQALKNLGKIREGIPYLFKAAALHRGCVLDYLIDLKEISECRLQISDFEGALTICTEMLLVIERKGLNDDGRRLAALTHFLTYAEVNGILLLLLLQPSKIQLNPEHKKLLDRYADINTEPVDYIDVDLYLMLQSLTMCVNEKDLRSLRELEKDLWPYLMGLQLDVLLTIIERMKDRATNQ